MTVWSTASAALEREVQQQDRQVGDPRNAVPPHHDHMHTPTGGSLWLGSVAVMCLLALNYLSKFSAECL